MQLNIRGCSRIVQSSYWSIRFYKWGGLVLGGGGETVLCVWKGDKMPKIVIICFNTSHNFGLKKWDDVISEVSIASNSWNTQFLPCPAALLFTKIWRGSGGILVVWFKIFPDLLQQHSAWHFQIPNLVCEFLEGELLAQFHHLKCTNWCESGLAREASLGFLEKLCKTLLLNAQSTLQCILQWMLQSGECRATLPLIRSESGQWRDRERN